MPISSYFSTTSLDLISDNNHTWFDLIIKLLESAEILSKAHNKGLYNFKSKIQEFSADDYLESKELNKQFQEIFQTKSPKKCSKNFFREYLERINSFGIFDEPIFLIAAYLFTEVIFSKQNLLITKFTTLKLFGVCLNFAQKLLLDKKLKATDFYKITGIKTAIITEGQIFLLFKIFNLKIPHSYHILQKFKIWLSTIDIRVKKLEGKLNKEN